MDPIDLFAKRATDAGVRIIGPAARSDLKASVSQVLSAARYPRVVVQPSTRDRFSWLDFAAEPSRQTLLTADLGMVEAAAGVAAIGSCLYTPCDANERLLALLTPACLIFLNTSDIVRELKSLQHGLEQRHSTNAQSLLITGPSRTGDIEHVLTVGVHGPGELFVALWHEDA